MLTRCYKGLSRTSQLMFIMTYRQICDMLTKSVIPITMMKIFLEH